jgi:hypothetical protein
MSRHPKRPRDPAQLAKRMIAIIASLHRKNKEKGESYGA